MSNSHKIQYLKDYKPSYFLIDSIHLHIELHEEKALVSAILSITKKTETGLDTPLVLDGDDLKLIEITLDSHPLGKKAYQITKEHLTIFKVPEHFTLKTTVEIRPKENTQLMGIYQSGEICASQCESNGFRRITYFLDRPDVLTRFTTTISADPKKYPYLLSNGNLVDQKKLDNGHHLVKWEDPDLKPCYLFAFVAGDFDLIEDAFKTHSNRTVKLQIFVEKGKKDQAYHAMECLKRAMKWDEKAFNREYDLDQYMIVAVNDFNFGAMENKGLNIFNDAYILAKPETATDQDYLNVESVVGHEYFHNWSGNRVTVRDWFQITLKEGLTVFREQSFMEETASGIAHRIAEVNLIRNRQFAEDAGPMAHPIRPDHYIEVNNFYTATVYNKGAEIIRMVKTLLGTEAFKKAMDFYFSRYDGKAVTTEDFIQAMEDSSGVDLFQFKLWYSQAGTPILTITDEFNEEKNRYKIHIKQSCPKTPADEGPKQPFHIPVSFGLLDSKGGTIEIEDEKVLLEVKQSEEIFTFHNITKRPIPSFLRGFSAPVKLKYNYSFKDLLLLAEHDSDAFNRWDAFQKLFIQCFEEKQTELPSEFIKTCQSLLNSKTDPILISQMLSLPSESYLLENLSYNDIDVIHHYYRKIKTSLAAALQQDFEIVYQKISASADNRYQMENIGKRALKNLCLDYLVSLKNADFIHLSQQQFQQAENMTDRMAALKPLTHINCPERNILLDAFYQQFEKEALIVDKWFKLQAESDLPDALEQVGKLTQHPRFDIKNPNRVRALIGSFAGQNLVHFHRKDGKGYHFLTEQILKVDRYNSMVASRLVEPLTHWKKMDKTRQDLMKQSLMQLKEEKKLSKNVYEVVSKSL
jgi:aminopeptidase N